MNKCSYLFGCLCIMGCAHNTQAHTYTKASDQLVGDTVVFVPTKEEVEEYHRSTAKTEREKSLALHLKSDTVRHNSMSEVDKAALRKRANEALKKIHQEAQGK